MSKCAYGDVKYLKLARKTLTQKQDYDTVKSSGILLSSQPQCNTVVWYKEGVIPNQSNNRGFYNCFQPEVRFCTPRGQSRGTAFFSVIHFCLASGAKSPITGSTNLFAAMLGKTAIMTATMSKTYTTPYLGQLLAGEGMLGAQMPKKSAEAQS